MSRRIRYAGHAFSILVAACVTSVQFSQAHECHLTEGAIHEAYVLGQRNDQSTAAFLHSYISECSTPEEGCFLTQIEMLTPFAQVVDLSMRNGTKDYTEEQAIGDYHRRGDKIIVQVTLVLRTAYAGAAQNNAQKNPPTEESKDATLRPENFWQNFRFNLKQHGKVIATHQIRNEPIYSTATKDAPPKLDGATVQLEYDCKDVASEEATIEVISPDSKTITASFDLKKLR